MSWTNPEDHDLIGNVVVQYKSSDDNEWQNVTVSAPIDSVMLSGLDPDKEYTARVVVESPDGKDSTVTDPITFNTIAGNHMILYVIFKWQLS